MATFWPHFGTDLSGNVKFEDITITEDPSKANKQGLGDETNIGDNKEISDYQTELKDVELSKDTKIIHKGKQNIPLEYKDLIK